MAKPYRKFKQIMIANVRIAITAEGGGRKSVRKAIQKVFTENSVYKLDSGSIHAHCIVI